MRWVRSGSGTDAAQRYATMMTKIPLCALLLLLVATTLNAGDLTDRVLAAAQSWTGKQVGGGECAHLADEALRVAGAGFATSKLGPDQPNAGDYVWGDLVATYLPGKTAAAVRPGDILQYRDVKCRFGKATATMAHHTSVVATVDRSGRPLTVYEQNFKEGQAPAVRQVRERPLDIGSISAGWIRAYRAKPRRDEPNSWTFSLTNLLPEPVKVDYVRDGKVTGSVNLDPAGTAGAYRVIPLTAKVTSSDGSPVHQELDPPGLVVGLRKPIPAVNAAGFEVRPGPDGKPILAQKADR